MTVQILNKLIEKYNIPEDVTIRSDSGWECGDTCMDGVYYNENKNVIIFKQGLSIYDEYYKDPDWKPIYGDFYSWEIDEIDPELLKTVTAEGEI